MRKFGLIGFPLGHSFSKGYFTEKFKKENIIDCDYQNYPISQIDEFRQLIETNVELLGLNVTIPYKEQIIKYLDKLDPVAEKIGAVNTIKIERNSGEIQLIGYNTDYYGFEETLKPYLQPEHKKALILGTGGASKAVAYVLNSLNISYQYVSRKPVNKETLSYQEVNTELIKDFTVIINTSPLGMYPNADACPDLPYESINSNYILYDLIYNPEKTLFLQKGESKNAIIINGLPMLHFQADKAWKIWNS
jgi:shikimate dehydrogenase